MQSIAGALQQGVQGVFLQGFVALLGCDAPPLSQRDPSCLALPSSHLPSPIPLFFFIFSLFSSSSLQPEVGPACRSCACEAQLCPWRAQHPTACERLTRSGMCSMWPRCSCHPLHFLMQFVPLLIELMDLRYGGGKAVDGRWKEGCPWPSRARLMLLRVLFENWGWARAGVVSGGGYTPSQRRMSLNESSSQNSSSSLGTLLAWAAERGTLCFPALCFSVQEHLSWHIYS